MRFNNLFHDGKTETHSAFSRWIGLEFFEDKPTAGIPCLYLESNTALYSTLYGSLQR